MLVMTIQASAMSYVQARDQALFLTDKMAYELNLTEDQYEAAYEINLDYLMNVNTVDDLYGTYWRYRNLDLSYILFDWQYRAFCDATYFYRPIYWDGGYWHFGIYARYPHRDYFFYGRPHFYTVYRGGHSWRMNGGHSWYRGRNDWGRPGGRQAVGMRDGFARGDYRNGFDNSRNRTFGNLNNRGTANNNGSRSFGNGASNNGAKPNNSTGNGNRSFGTFGNGSRNSRTTTGRMQSRTIGSNTSQNTRTMGTARQAQTVSGGALQNNKQHTFGNRTVGSVPQSSTRTTVTRQQSVRQNFGSQSRTMNRSSFERPATQQRTFSAPSSTTSRSFGSSSRSIGGSRSSGSSSSSHGSFGGHR